ncbi:hypothetical protein CC86DRAFT_283814 [Ophiobolus disseminans]|uniref:Lysine-specific metallo-endopeptidase domain-containing protein n=1 Tax=Ophiobolus disseminans TaxID=1469910 RepID=A0A6A7ACC9_9PLEO|nr:hypothetical protein CC86DRAFT_283814 [Ophiobolus disseminans]
MGDPKYRPASLEFWFGSEHNNDASFAKIRGVFDNFVGQNTDGTGSDRLGQTTVRNEDYWVPSTDEGGDGTTMFCSIVKDGKTAAAYFKTFESKAAMHFCDKVFDRGNLEALTANNCANVGDQISTKKWTKNFIGANVLHEFMHNPRIGRDAALKRIGDVAYGAWLCRQLAIDQDIERRKKTIYNADTYNCGRSFSEPRDESGDTDNAADNGVADSDPESDDPTNGACDCGESSCTPDSRACCANGSCLPLED